MPSELLDKFENHIAETALDVAASETRNRPEWFTEAEQTLINAIQARNDAFKNFPRHHN